MDGTIESLRSTARVLCRRGFGILAADESTGTIGKRLIPHRIENTPENRRQFRELLICAHGIEAALSGVILFDETFYQKTADNTPFVQILSQKGILPGIKVDTGLKPLEGHPGETYTSGIETLPARCAKYAADGARFAKWRAAFTVSVADALPSDDAVRVNALLLARYAKCAHDAGLVPIVEPEILIDGAHEQGVSAAVAKRVIRACYTALDELNVDIAATLLKPMMVMPGRDCPGKSDVTAEMVARVTLEVMREVVPPAVPGIMFLSGGMSERSATANLNALNVLADREKVPWNLSFSYGRALQSSVLRIWASDRTKTAEASAVAAELARANGRAQLGKFEGEHPSGLDDASLYENFRGWRSGEDKKDT